MIKTHRCCAREHLLTLHSHTHSHDIQNHSPFHSHTTRKAPKRLDDITNVSYVCAVVGPALPPRTYQRVTEDVSDGKMESQLV